MDISSDEGTPIEIAKKYNLNLVVQLLERHKTQMKCGCCLQLFYTQHFHFEVPDQWKLMNLSNNSSDPKIRYSSDLCQIIDSYFIKCLLEIPIKHNESKKKKNSFFFILFFFFYFYVLFIFILKFFFIFCLFLFFKIFFILFYFILFYFIFILFLFLYFLLF